MQTGSGGSIITISAKPALQLPAGMGAYAVSKAAVLALTEILANEGTASNIRVNSILPGVIDTATNREAMPDADYSKWVTPEDIAEMIMSLTENPAVSGSQIKMFGNI
jgi:NAD(P)-dependent dehydrogenase (short-subunit alcohol dehydrogenase family)